MRRDTHDVSEPVVLGVVLVLLVARVAEDHLDLVFLLLRRAGVGVGGGVLVNLDVEAEHDGVVGGFFQHDAALHHVSLVHRSDANVGDGNLAVFQEVEQGFQRSKG